MRDCDRQSRNVQFLTGALVAGGGSSCAQPVVRRCNRCAISLVGIRPDGGEVVAVAPRVAALDADVNARWRRVVDPRGHRKPDAAVFPAAVTALYDRAAAFPPLELVGPHRDLARTVRARQRIGERSGRRGENTRTVVPTTLCSGDHALVRAGRRRCPMLCSSATACQPTQAPAASGVSGRIWTTGGTSSTSSTVACFVRM